MDERRKFSRFKLGVEVHWKKIAGADERTAQHISHLKDISVGGICLVLHSGIFAGDTLDLEIKLPGRKSIYSKGKVMWVDYDARIPKRTSTACEGGIQFLDMDETTRKEISDFAGDSFINESRK